MGTPKADKSIDQLLDEFLADQEVRIGPKTFAKYRSVVDLYKSYLEAYWPDHSGADYDAVTKAKGTYCGTYGAEDITKGFSEFLGYFLPRKVIGGVETIKAAGTVIKKLTKWLIENRHVRDDDSTRGRIGSTARDLPGTQKLLRELEDWLREAGPVKAGEAIEGHFWIHQVEPRQIWFEPVLGGEKIGPISTPARVAKACKVGWDVGGVVASTSQGWRLIEVWNVSP